MFYAGVGMARGEKGRGKMIDGVEFDVRADHRDSSWRMLFPAGETSAPIALYTFQSSCCHKKMTTDKYTPFESRLESILKGIDSEVREIKEMIGGMYEQITDLTHISDAVYRSVSYHPHDPTHVPDDEWDFLDEE